jgi:hypothetical protein
MTDELPKLLPCPFCGSSKLRLGRKVAGHGDSVESISCDCGIELAPMGWDVDIVKAWNTRASTVCREQQ